MHGNVQREEASTEADASQFSRVLVTLAWFRGGRIRMPESNGVVFFRLVLKRMRL